MIKLVTLQGRSEEALCLAEKTFGFLGYDTRSELSSVDWGLSQGVEVDGVLAAIYLLSAADEPMGILKGQGLCGEALAVDPDYRGRGLSSILLGYAYSLGFDYLWGYQDKRLDNLPFWLKTRTLLGEHNGAYVTARILK